MANPDGSEGTPEGAGAATGAGKETGHRQITYHSNSSKSSKMGMGDAVAQWDKIQEEFASNTLDMSKWGEIFYGGQPSREKFAKLICNINPKTFAKYAHNNKASRTLVGSKRGRPTREAAASKQAAKDRARMTRWQKKQAEELKQQQLLNNLVNTPGPEKDFYDLCQQTNPFIYRAFYYPPPFGREELPWEREARRHTMLRKVVKSRGFQLGLYLKKKGIIDHVYTGKVGKFDLYRHMMHPENSDYAPPSHLWGRIPNASCIWKSDYIKWCGNYERELEDNEELQSNHGNHLFHKRNIPEDAKP